MEKHEGYFIQHCDDPCCDLGTFEYSCPVCNKRGVDYSQIFYKQDELWEGKIISFICDSCKGKLKVFYSDDLNNYGYFIEKDI